MLVVWLIACAYALGIGVVEASGARRDLEQLRASYSSEELLEQEGRDGLRAVGARFIASERRLSSIVLAPVRITPVLGRQVRSLEALASAGGEVIDTAADAAEVIDGLRATVEMRGRVATVEELGATVAAVEVRLSAVSLGPSDALIGPLHDARARIAEELDEARRSASDAQAVTSGLVDLLKGSRYLILAANNAEMQAGWGMPLSVGVLDVVEGDLDLGEMTPTADAVLPEGAVAPVGDLADNWGFLRPTQDFRLLALTPHFTQAAPLAAQMWEARGEAPVDGVLALDPLALAAILSVTGPVEVDGRQVSEDDVVALSLHDSYVEQAAAGPGQEERRERQSQVAVAAVKAMSRPDTDIVELARSLADAASRRHVLAWSSTPVQQRAWETAGVDGSLQAGSLLVSTVNRGANKLDWFMDLEAKLSSRSTAHGLEVTVDLSVENQAPELEPKYIAGPEGTFGAAAPGDWAGYLTLHLPGAARGGRFNGIDELVAAGASGPGRLVAVRIDVPRGTSERLTARFTVPADTPLVIEPSARVRPLRWRHGDERWADDERRTVVLSG